MKCPTLGRLPRVLREHLVKAEGTPGQRCPSGRHSSVHEFPSSAGEPHGVLGEERLQPRLERVRSFHSPTPSAPQGGPHRPRDAPAGLSLSSLRFHGARG